MEKGRFDDDTMTMIVLIALVAILVVSIGLAFFVEI